MNKKNLPVTVYASIAIGLGVAAFVVALLWQTDSNGVSASTAAATPGSILRSILIFVGVGFIIYGGLLLLLTWYRTRTGDTAEPTMADPDHPPNELTPMPPDATTRRSPPA